MTRQETVEDVRFVDTTSTSLNWILVVVLETSRLIRIVTVAMETRRLIRIFTVAMECSRLAEMIAVAIETSRLIRACHQCERFACQCDSSQLIDRVIIG